MGRVGAQWPELYVVGANRAGTTSLWHYLGHHPQIFMSRLKEPHFFGDYTPDYIATVSDEVSYLRLFRDARPGQLRGEASPSYLTSKAAPEEIARVRPDARIIAILREPVARAYSSYWHNVRYGRESRTFLGAIRESLADPAARGGPRRYTRGGLYAQHLARYLEVFPGRVLVLFLEELSADPRGEIRRTFGFLGVDDTEADRVDLEIRNAHGLPRSALVRRAYASKRLRGLGARIVPGALQPRLEGVLLRRAAPPPVEPEARRLLEDFYAPQAPALERLLGRAVPWAAKGGGDARPTVATKTAR